MNPKIDSQKEFDAQVKEVCELYENADALAASGTHIISTDEKTGIQAKEHLRPSKPVKPGSVEKIEEEYVRHGTLSLIASRNITTGEIVAPLVRPTRTENDFVDHFREVVSNNPSANYIFIMDQLNTHKSESMVKYVANQCNITTDLGIKGKCGILKNMKSREEFLRDKSHRIRIVYSPKHSSWMNQIEMWFSIIGRQLLNRRASFKSLENLKDKIIDYIKYYNRCLAKPFTWIYNGERKRLGI